MIHEVLKRLQIHKDRIRKLINPDPPSDVPYMKIPLLRELEIFGICGPNRVPVRFCIVHFILGITFMIIPTIISVINESSIHGRIKKLGYLVVLTTATINFATLALKREKFDRLLEFTENIYRTGNYLL